jgi:mevalonate kinase
LGSGAAVSTAVVKALVRYFEREVSLQTVSDLVFEVEKLHHGTPSGIDNSVVAFAQPIFFVKGRPITRLKVKSPLTFVIADTGVKSPTHKVVGDLRSRRSQEVERYEGYFDEIAVIALQARVAVEQGFLSSIGRYMIENHILLDRLGVSSPLLNTLVDTAMAAGALGAKLSGAGWGGNMIALTALSGAEEVALALRRAGAVDTIITQVQSG